MGIYKPRPKRATKKARATRSPVKGKGRRGTLTTAPKKAEEKPKKRVKPAASKRVKPGSSPAKRGKARAKKAVKRAKVQAKLAPKAKSKAASPAKTRAPKKLASKKFLPKRKKKPAPKRKRAKKTSAKARAAAQLKALREEVLRLRKLQPPLRGEPKRSTLKKEHKEERAAISDKRLKKALVTAGLPRQTPAEIQASAETHFQRIRKRFRQLLTLAETKTKKHVTGQTPSKKRISHRFSTDRTVGEQRKVRIRRILRPGMVQDVLYKVDQAVRGMKGAYRLWWATLAFSGFGERLFGYGNQLLDANDPDAQFFQVQGYDNTGLYNTYPAMRESLEELLDEYAKTARTVIYLHFIRVMNFDRK